ncbi:hypothetical protein A8B75_19090 [Sphingomonadales bacterium EhC05]|nr:hypothetical protein A8B75_19090 [Sphingomonadales bacterium EhC05]
MTDIEFIMSFVAVLYGLVLANVANNMADAVRARHDLPIGFIPWAISFYIAGSSIYSYGVYYVGREEYQFDILSISALLAAIVPYIFVSRLLYPEHKDRWNSVEDYYLANRKLILGVMAIAPFVTIFSLFYNIIDVPISELAISVFIIAGTPLLAMLALTLTDKLRWHQAGFGFLILHRIAMLIWLSIEIG